MGDPAKYGGGIPPDSIWRCPCGFTASFYTLLGHRHGWKRRPECHGKMVQVGGPGDFQPLDPEIETPPEERFLSEPPVLESTEETLDRVGISTPTDESSPPSPIRPSIFEFTGETDDAEELARLYNMTRDQMGGATGDGGKHLDIMDGEFAIEYPADAAVSTTRETVTLPVSARVMYDWYRSRGWNKGDGSLSAWAWDIIYHHWHTVARRFITVGDLDEIGVA